MKRRSPVPIPGNSNDPNMFRDLIDWQSEALTEPVEELRGRLSDELNEFKLMLVMMNHLLREPPCRCGCNVAILSEAMHEAMRLSMSVAICVLGIAYRNPGGL